MGPTASYADDTDIYLSTNKNIASVPLVMLTLDMKANNLAAAFCTYDGTGTDDCFAKVGADIYPYFKKAQDDYGLNYVVNGVNRFDAFRALHAALYEDLTGVEIGFMVSHNEQTADGGYVLRGFRPFLEGDTNGAKKELLDKLYSIPNPRGATGGSGWWWRWWWRRRGWLGFLQRPERHAFLSLADARQQYADFHGPVDATWNEGDSVT